MTSQIKSRKILYFFLNLTFFHFKFYFLFHEKRKKVDSSIEHLHWGRIG